MERCAECGWEIEEEAGGRCYHCAPVTAEESAAILSYAMGVEFEVIDQHFQPCYIDWCPEEGTTDIEVSPGEWRSFCPKHVGEGQGSKP